MKTYKIKSVILFSLIGGNVFSQNDSTFWNSKMAKIAMSNSSPGWVRLKENLQFAPADFFSQNKEAFGLKQDDNLILIKTKSDELGFAHYRYQHNYKGIKVEGCEYILHTRGGNVVSANGKLACNLDFNVTPSVSESSALPVALNSISALKYGWEIKKNDTTFWSAYPQGELLLARIMNNKDFSQSNFKLAFRFNIFAIEPYSDHAVYVDATTGEVIKKQNLLRDFHCNCCDGTAQTLYNGQQTIVTRHRGFPNFNYLLKDNCRGDGIETFLAGANLTDGDNDWSATDERPATSAHWAAEMTYDFYNNTYGRNSFDNSGAKIDIYLSGTADDGAGWRSSIQAFGFGSGGAGQTHSAVVSLDVVGHEFTHAVDENEANLVENYVGETGALSESFADIFGAMVEFYAEGNNGNYLLGEDYWIQDGYTRSMLDPNAKTEAFSISDCPGGIYSYKQPDTYNGNYWIDYASYPNCDNGGVHINSGVQNFWFYLLSEGGNGTNDNGDAYNVIGINRNKAAAIAYRNLSVYLWNSADYADAKNGSIFSAMDLYGTCSNEVLQTVNAWNAVGVSSSTGFGYDLVVNCAELNFYHNGSPGNPPFSPPKPPQPYTAQAIGNLTANCAITPNGQPVTFIAGQSITLTAGFQSGDNFHAFIDPCLAASNKMANTNNNGNNQSENIKQGTMIADNKNGAEIIDNSIAKKLSVFPNPSKGQFILNISLKEKENFSIHIHDVMGQLVYEKSNQSKNNLDLDLSHKSKGIYFIKVISQENIHTQKIIIQ